MRFQSEQRQRVVVLARDAEVRLLKNLAHSRAFVDFFQSMGFDWKEQVVKVDELPTGLENPNQLLFALISRQKTWPDFDLCLYGLGAAPSAPPSASSCLSSDYDLWKQVFPNMAPFPCLDLGVEGMKALTGCVSLFRPSMRFWVNVRLLNYPYRMEQNSEFLRESAIYTQREVTPTVMWSSNIHHSSMLEHLQKQLGYHVFRSTGQGKYNYYVLTDSSFNMDRPPWPLAAMQPGVLYVSLLHHYMATSTDWVWKAVVTYHTTHGTVWDPKTLARDLSFQEKNPSHVYVQPI